MRRSMVAVRAAAAAVLQGGLLRLYGRATEVAAVTGWLAGRAGG